MNRPNFDEVLKVINEHGEPKDCLMSNCKTCDYIKNARLFYNGKPITKQEIKKGKQVYRYKLTSIKGEVSEFTAYVDVIKIIKCDYTMLKKILNTGKYYKGYKVDRERVKE